MTKIDKARGGTDAVQILRSKGSMSMADFKEVTMDICGRKGDSRYRAQKTLEILEKRGAFVVEDGIAYARYGGDYARILDSLAESPKTFQELQDELGLGRGNVQTILTDLEKAKEVVKLPPVSTKRRWTLAKNAKGINPDMPAIDMYADRLIELCSERPMASKDIAEILGLTTSVVSGYMRILVARGQMNGASFPSQDYMLWYSTDEAFNELNRMRESGFGRSNKGLDFSKGASIGGRNPDFMTNKVMESMIIEVLSEGTPLSEKELMKKLRRTRPIKKMLNRMWCEGKLDMSYIDGVWKWILKH